MKLKKIFRLLRMMFWWIIYPLEVFEMEWGSVDKPAYSREQLDDYWNIYWRKNGII